MGSRGWRRTWIVLAVLLAIAAGVWFGVLPGSSALGRYPFWELRALADRINARPDTTMTWCADDDAEAEVDLLRGRVIFSASTSTFGLTDRERAMIEAPGGGPYQAICAAPRYTD